MTLKEEILKLRETGKTYSEIIILLGCSKGTVAYHCSVSVREKAKKRNKDKRNMMRREIERIKNEAVCMDCGKDYPHFMMDFDHRLGVNKKYNISNTRLIPSMKSLLEEILKCDIVCANCHRTRTWERKTKWAIMEG